MASEVALLRQQIEAECQSLRLATTGFAIGSSHQMIAARYACLSTCHQGLALLVGQQADVILTEIYCQVMDEGSKEKETL